MVGNITPLIGFCSVFSGVLALGARHWRRRLASGVSSAYRLVPSSRIRGQPLAASDVGHAFYAARRANDLLEVREVLHLDEHRAIRASVDAAEVHALDVRPRGAHGGRDVRVQTAPVVALERETDEEPLALGLLPIDLEPALRLVGE